VAHRKNGAGANSATATDEVGRRLAQIPTKNIYPKNTAKNTTFAIALVFTIFTLI
jgi:hypothetical protein